MKIIHTEWSIPKLCNSDYLKRRYNTSGARLNQLRTGYKHYKQVLFEGEDYDYEKTKIKYYSSAVQKLDEYFAEKLSRQKVTIV